ncbi:MAG: glycoside hydrolase family 25 protein [Ruminococcus sp.]|nr:glycoside hydrolase family 25 protein [Ruminococcus sp.]
MKLYKRMLSAFVSFAVAGLSVVSAESVQTTAVDDGEDILYNITDSEESKEESSTTEIYTTDTTTSTEEFSEETTTTTLTEQDIVTEEPFNVFDIYNAYKGYTTTAETTTETTTTEETTTTTTTEETTTTTTTDLVYRQAKGIDVSSWQPDIDWNKVKDSGIEFAICRAGYGKYISQKDPTFDYNMQNAQALGIDCGAYWYSYATDVESAVQEAEVCYSVIKGYDFTYPVYFDIEDAVHTNLSTAQISAITEAFCSTLESKGYRVGIYSYTNFLKTKIYSSLLEKYDVWVAHFDVASPSYSGDYGIWQYTASGSVDGVPGAVDLDISYVNYPYLMSPETYVPKTTTSFDSGLHAITTTTASGSESSFKERGIDVSQWQGNIDWSAVKSSGSVDYAIIRAGYGRFATQKDTYFDYNMQQAKANDIKCGAYWYSYATTAEDAVKEAKAFCEVIDGYQFEYPVYFDIEDTVHTNLTKSQLDDITEAFCSYMEEQGYCCGITSYTNFLNQKISSSVLQKYAVWVAHYNVNKPGYNGYYGMWQYSCTGTVNGINGSVDLDYAYVNYPLLMPILNKNGY